ncbi:bifunctional transcriptional activator/DNA repair enzyme AdaA [Paenibacillus sp. J31TS4]|uniref:bifunctional transcriptional activator/DNA repair enzyme AdaA n=1 Tax=Paenibacillus sp. J31TS4 TaxID=2807195 RepID=UPI001B147A05|nr:bifunctional transcriptional activator/DNA repair enzyme AdaA [Paenibacillus sp. J31TS4]GIP38537.1 bifunctional transcriptional activator/DNA repair enzyme AdaA [Paenibacillus sp. J31TS4]
MENNYEREEGAGEQGQGGIAAAEELSEERWRAIVQSDAAYDGRFFYAVQTTGIFCRPSCKSRPPKKENVRIFPDAEHALAARFRPCKRCRPTGRRLPNQEWVAQIAAYIDAHYRETLSLETLADACHGSPYHLQRTFKRIKGISPVEYLQRTRIARAKEELLRTDHSIAEVAEAVGMANTPYFITLFKRKTGHTPADYRQSMAPPVMKEDVSYDHPNQS